MTKLYSLTYGVIKHNNKEVESFLTHLLDTDFQGYKINSDDSIGNFFGAVIYISKNYDNSTGTWI